MISLNNTNVLTQYSKQQDEKYTVSTYLYVADNMYVLITLH